MTKASQMALNTSRQIQRSFTLIGVGATAMAGAVTVALGKMAESAEDYAFSIQRAASITGTSNEMFSKLAYNAKLAGVPMDNLKMSMERLARTSFAAQSGNKEAIAAYSALGISVKDLKGPLADSGDLFVAVSKAIDKFKDSTAKTGVEQKLLGRSGAEIAPLIQQVATGFDTAANQATLFGVVIGDKTAEQARKLHEAMVQIESVSLGVSLRLLSGVAPALETVSGQILKVITSVGGIQTIQSVASGLSSTIIFLGKAFEFLSEHATAVKRTLELIAVEQLASVFLPMAASAVKGGKGISDIGIALLQLAGKSSGITAISRAIGTLFKSSIETVSTLGSLAKTEGIVASASLGLEMATDSVTGAMAALDAALLLNPFVDAAVAIVAAAGALYYFRDATISTGNESFKLKDTWHAYYLYIEDVTRTAATHVASFWKPTISALGTAWTNTIAVLRTAWTNYVDGITDVWEGFTDTFSKFDLPGIVKTWLGALGDLKNSIKDLLPDFVNPISVYLQAAKNQREGLPGPPAAPGVPTGVAGLTAPKKTNAPDLGAIGADKLDIVKKKLTDLRDEADKARLALNDVGKNPDYSRADQAAIESKKIIDDLNAQLEVKHKHVDTDTQDAIRNYVASRVNTEAEAQYASNLSKSTDEAIANAKAQDILTAAVGRGAQATADAEIAAARVKRTAGQSDEFNKKYSAAQDRFDALSGLDKEAANRKTDADAVKGLQAQIDEQLRLNAAIGQGKDAREAAALFSQKQAVIDAYASRGDTNVGNLDRELDAVENLYKAKKKEADLESATSMDVNFQYNEQIKKLNDIAQAGEEAGHALSSMQLAAGYKQAWEDLNNSVNKTRLAVGSLSDGASVFFQELTTNAESAAQQMHDVLSKAFESLNSTLVKIMQGGKVEFSSFFKDIAGQMGQLGLKKVESGITSGIMGKLGIKATVDPTTAAVNKANDYLRQIAGNTAAAAGTAGAGGAGGTAAAVTDAVGSGTRSGLGGFASGIMSTLGSAVAGFIPFGGHRAMGGSVSAGMSYDVGEMGRETFIPHTNGTIVPNHKLGGGSSPIYIDATGSQDPAATEAAIHRALLAYTPHIMKSMAKANTQSHLRKPSGH